MSPEQVIALFFGTAAFVVAEVAAVYAFWNRRYLLVYAFGVGGVLTAVAALIYCEVIGISPVLALVTRVLGLSTMSCFAWSFIGAQTPGRPPNWAP